MKKEIEYYITINKEVCDYLERLSYDIETRKSIIAAYLTKPKAHPMTQFLRVRHSSPTMQSWKRQLPLTKQQRKI